MRTFAVQFIKMKVKSDHRSIFSNLSNWKEEAWKMSGKIYCDDHSSLSSTIAVQYEFHKYFTSFHCTGRYELNKLTSLPMCGFTAQLVEHRTGITEVMGSSPVEALIFFRLLPSNCLNWKIYCGDHSSLSSTTAVQYEFHVYFTSLKCCQFPKVTTAGFWLSGYNWQLLLCAQTLHCQLTGFVCVHNFNSTVFGK